MTWLNGIPKKIRKLTRPTETSSLRHRGTSILDNHILQFFTRPATSSDTPLQTAVYVADLQDDSHSLAFEKIAETSLPLSRIELLPAGNSDPEEFFASAEWDKRSPQLVLRTHTRTGRILKETSIGATAAYGNLAVGVDKIAFCISSGNAPSDRPEFYDGLRDVVRGVRLDRSSRETSSTIPDQIVVWDHSRLRVHIVKIFQHIPSQPMLHSANIGFVRPDIIALAGQIESTYGMDAALLHCQSIISPDAYSRTFAQGEHISRDLICREMGKAGSSQKGNVFLHVHDGSRISIFNQDLLTGKIASCHMSDFPSFHKATVHRSYHRCIWGNVNGAASYAADRVLIVREPDPEISDDITPIAWILDFNSQRVKDIVDLDESGREELKTSLEEEKAQVNVITRRFCINSVGEEDDQEFPHPTTPNEEWSNHLGELYQKRIDRFEDESGPPALEFEEAPEEHRDDVLFGYIETKVKCPEGLDPCRLAITSSALIYISQGAQEEWLIFDFED